MCLVRASFEENERMAWIVEMESEVCFETEQVRNGLPRTRWNRRLEEGKSRVTLRSSKAEMTWVSGWGFWVLEMVRSAVKAWYVKEGVENRDG